MAFDGFITKVIAYELNHNIVGARLNKIYEPTKTDLIFGLYSNGENMALHICVHPENYRVCLTNFSKPNPLQAPNFCMLLRKHLLNGKLLEIKTYDLERIIEFVFEVYNELNDKVIKKLVVELMAGHSNIILVNESGVIIDTLRHISIDGVLRELMPARYYEMPSTTKISISSISFEKLLKIFNTENNIYSNIDKTFSDNFIGISRRLIQYICIKLEINLANCNKEELEKIYIYLRNMLENPDKLTFFCTNNSKDYFIDFGEKPSSCFVNYSLDDFCTAKEQSNEYKTARNELLKTVSSYLKKYLKRLENINNKLNDCESMDKYRLYGELITSNLYKFSGSTPSEIVVQNYYNENKEISIPLDKSLSGSKNAEKYFKKYNKLKNTLEIVTLQKRETEIELEYMESIIFSVENSTTIFDLNEISKEIEESDLFKPSSNKSKKVIGNINKSKKIIDTNIGEPLKFIIDGFTVFVGKNNRQNDYLTFRVATKQDFWFHTKQVQGSHVILKTEGKQVPIPVLEKCAKLAAEHSKAKNGVNVPVDYCLAIKVKKPNGAKPGMVVYTNYKTINI